MSEQPVVTQAPEGAPQQAQMPQQPPEPSFDQAVAGIHKFYRRFRAVEIAYRQINDTLNDRRDSPVFEMPTGQFDEEDRPITVPMDMERLLRGLSVEQRAEHLKQLLGPWNNYFAREYSDSVEQLKRFVDATHVFMQRQGG